MKNVLFGGLVILLYAPMRFFLDTLRIADPRYFGMTPGQYFSIVFSFLGLFLFIGGLRSTR